MIFLDLSKGDFYNALKAFVQCITFTPSSGVEKRGSSIAVDSTSKVCVQAVQYLKRKKVHKKFFQNYRKCRLTWLKNFFTGWKLKSTSYLSFKIS